MYKFLLRPLLLIAKQVDIFRLLVGLFLIVLVLWLKVSITHLARIRPMSDRIPASPCQVDRNKPETYPGQHADLEKYGHLCRFAMANGYQ
ncbi:hypothetical protein IT412_01200 [Candidatus Peregrinibacteria bacterium]|nr:hypothetical protein [Candidatus Peregrinibacteria bacterium]